jgi:hypothetical protein
MEKVMAKRLARSAKEKPVSVRTEARQLLWGAVPQRFGDNRKSWFEHAARVLGWKPRRVRAVWNSEARIISAAEMRQLEERYEAQQQRATRRQKDRDDIRRALLSTPSDRAPLAKRAPDRSARSAGTGSRGVGQGQGQFFFLDDVDE